MCPIWPAQTLILYAAIFCSLWLASYGNVGVTAQTISPLLITFEPSSVKQLLEGNIQEINMTYNQTLMMQDSNTSIVEIQYFSKDPKIADVNPESVSIDNPELEGQYFFNITANFLGYTEVCAKIVDANNDSTVVDCIKVSVIRKSGILDKVFTFSVVALVSVIYVNMGAALDTKVLKETLKRPVGPVIGFFSQFVIMPLLSFVIAKLLIPLPALQLGLFITGCSPGGGASNIWTLTLGGNLDLSIAMTTISSLSAFAMMPLWIMTLGSTIFAEANLTVPYSKLATFAVALVVPLAIGIVIQYKLPKIAKGLVRILKPFAVFLILFIIAFAVYTNLYLFQLFTWRILLAGMLLPWLGYLLGGGTAWVLKQEWKDIIAIAVETGVQNTGLAIFALRFSLEQPEADLTTALPVAVAVMTPVIPTILIIVQKLFRTRFQTETEPKKENSRICTDPTTYSSTSRQFEGRSNAALEE